MLRLLLAALLTLPAAAAAAQPDAGRPGAGSFNIQAQQGHRFVRTHCAACHAVERFDDSPLAIAPPLRTLHELYPVENLAEALAEGIVTGHPTMPQFVLEPDQIENVIAYLKTLE